MIRYLITTAFTIIWAATKPSITIFQKISRKFRAMPWQSDDLIALYHGKYHDFMDQARWEFVSRVGFVKAAKQKKWFLIFGGEKVFYRRPIKIFEAFEVDMEVVGWDNNWFYARHTFHVDGRVAAIGYVRTQVREEGRLIPTSEALRAIGAPESSPAWPDDLKAWVEAENKVKKLFEAVEKHAPVRSPDSISI